MKITLLGTGSSIPDPTRVQSGVLVEDEGDKILLDVGSGTLHRLTQTGIDLTKISAIFMSHFHIDHCSDFLPLVQSLWLSGYDRTLKVYAPPTIREWSRGLRNVAFPYLLHKLEIDIHIVHENEALQHGPFAVSTCPTTHGSMDSRAFRIESSGKKFTFSSDTAPCREVIELASGSDVLVHECNWLDGHHPEGVHTSPSELAMVVEKSNPKKLVLNHMAPEVVQNADKVIASVSRRTKAEVILGEDLMIL